MQESYVKIRIKSQALAISASIMLFFLHKIDINKNQYLKSHRMDKDDVFKEILIVGS